MQLLNTGANHSYGLTVARIRVVKGITLKAALEILMMPMERLRQVSVSVSLSQNVSESEIETESGECMSERASEGVSEGTRE